MQAKQSVYCVKVLLNFTLLSRKVLGTTTLWTITYSTNIQMKINKNFHT